MVSCFNLRASDIMWYGTSFHMLICHLYIFFGKIFVEIVCYFINCLIIDFLRDFFVHFG